MAMSVFSNLSAYKKRSNTTKYKNWQDAKAGSLGADGYLKNIDPDYQHGCHKNSPNPAAWIVQGYDKSKPASECVPIDEWYVSWRIAGNMVYFTEEQKTTKQGYLMAGSSKAQAIEVLKKIKLEVEGDAFDAEIEEAFNRRKKKKAPEAE